MMRCRQCNGKVEKDSQFCKHCGAVLGEAGTPDSAAPAGFCAKCGARLPGGGRFCVICGTAAGEVPEPEPLEAFLPSPPKRRGSESFTYEDTAELPGDALPKPEKPVKTRRSPIRFAWTLMLLLVAAAAGVGLWLFFPILMPGGAVPPTEAVLFLREDGVLCLYAPGGEPIEVKRDFVPPSDGDVNQVARLSDDGRYLAYLDGFGPSDGGVESGELYLLDLTKLGRSELQHREGTRIGEHIREDFRFSARGGYLVFLSADGTLYAYNFKDRATLDAEVSQIVDVGEKQVVYAKDTAPAAGLPVERLDIYLRSADVAQDDKLLVATGASRLLDWTANFDTFLYTQARRNPSSDAYTYDINTYSRSQNQRQTLATGVDEVLDASADSLSVVYLKESSFVAGYEFFVDDPVAQSDGDMRRPTPDEFGLPDNYQDIFEREVDSDNRQWELEMEDLYYDSYLDFQRAIKAYEEKQDRDTLREQVRGNLEAMAGAGVRRYGLHLYQGTLSTVLEEDLFLFSAGPQSRVEEIVEADLERGYIVYLRSLPGSMRRIEFGAIGEGELNRDFSTASYLLANLPQQLVYTVPGESAVEVAQDLADHRIAAWAVSEQGAGIYYLTVDRQDAGDGGQLLYKSLSGELDTPLHVDMDVQLIADSSQTFDGSMLYLRGLFDGSCDLYGVRDGQTQRCLAQDIAFEPLFSSENGGNSVVFYRNPLGAGGDVGKELYLLTGEERLLSSDVVSSDYRGDRLIYFVRSWDEAEGAGELHLYTGAGVDKVAGVRQVYPLAVPE